MIDIAYFYKEKKDAFDVSGFIANVELSNVESYRKQEAATFLLIYAGNVMCIAYEVGWDFVIAPEQQQQSQ